MARRKNRMGILKRQREQRKAEKREEKQLRRQRRRELAETGELPETGDSPEDGEPIDASALEPESAELRSESRMLDEAE